jgi:hypothetical protein
MKPGSRQPTVRAGAAENCNNFVTIGFHMIIYVGELD